MTATRVAHAPLNGSARKDRPPDGVAVERRPDGWLVVTRPFAAADGLDPLAAHADWAGCVKLVQCGAALEQRFEYFLGGAAVTFDEEAAAEGEQLARELVQGAADFDGAARVAGWEPPAAGVLAAWLTEVGHESAADKDGNLRLTLKRRGCDGQVRLERGPGRLRLTMPFGLWKPLGVARASAMRHLAGLANAHGRLVRIAWHTEGDAQRCEAQVDLSGLVSADADAPGHQCLGRDLLRLAVRGLELALRRLGLELPALAEPRNEELAAAVAEYVG
jgi:hypothetical protein